MLEQLPDDSRYRQAIIDAYAVATDDWDLDVLAGLLMRFADEGDAEAGQVLRESLDRLPPGVVERVAYRFVQLDGLAALPAVVARFGADGDDWLRTQAEEEFGQEAVAAILAASTDPRVRAFDEATRPSDEPRQLSPRRDPRRIAGETRRQSRRGEGQRSTPSLATLGPTNCYALST